MNREEEILEKAVIRFDAKLLGTVFGLILGLGLFAATVILVLKGGPNPGAHLGLLAQFFPGYSISFVGSIVGFLYAFAVGFLIGAVIGVVYNKVARV
jgi:hypothetical protein